jgi:hypothetical protein
VTGWDPGGGVPAGNAHQVLLDAIKQRLDDVDRLVSACAEAEEDAVYRYYHQSFKVFGLQHLISHAGRLFAELAPGGTGLNPWFVAICDAATDHQFDLRRSNANWHTETRPILEAFWHCSYFARMLARYGRELDTAPEALPFGWAALLYLYGLR